MKHPRQSRFARALKEFDEYRTELQKQLKSGCITHEEYEKKLTDKAMELDL